MSKSKTNISTLFSNLFGLNTSNKKNSLYYLYGLDIIKFIAIINIINYHMYEALFYEDRPPFEESLVETINRAFSISIFVIITLLSFLYGFKSPSKKRWKKLLILLPLGCVVLLLTQGDVPLTDLYTDWDIFGFLIISILSLYFLNKLKLIMPAAFIGFILLSIPLWEWFPHEGSYLKNIFIGNCIKDKPGNAFPLFPWIGLIWLCYGLGVWTKDKGLKYLSKWQKKEIIIWCVLLIIASPQWGAYYHTPIGPGFYCFMLRQAPIIFWSHFIVILLLIRLSLIHNINHFLSQIKICHGLHSLAWIRSFGICYITHFIFIALYQILLPIKTSETHVFMGTVQAFILTEISVRVFTYLKKNIGNSIFYIEK